jgi:hypothetical protein
MCKTIVLSVVVYECETWSLVLREEQSLKVFDNRVLRRIIGLKRDEVLGGWRNLHNEELHDFYSTPSIIRRGRRGVWREWGEEKSVWVTGKKTRRKESTRKTNT